MEIKSLTVGQLQANCFLVWCSKTRETVIIDPGDESDFIAQKIQELNLKPVKIVATHGHYDHTLAANDLRLIFNIPFYLSPTDFFLFKKVCPIPPSPMPESIGFGQKKLKVIKTPGHTPGSVSFYANKVLFSGDTLFCQGVGRTDLPYSSAIELQKSLNLLFKLPPETKVLPGHGEETSIKAEKLTASV